MCVECVNSVKEFFPGVPDSEMGDFLMSCTSFPFGEAPEIREQLRVLKSKTDDYKKCVAIVEAETDSLMEAVDKTE